MFGLGLDAIAIIMLIGFVNFVFWKLVLQNFIRDKTKRLIFQWFATIVMTPAIYLAVIVGLIFNFNNTPKRDFDIKEWHADRVSRYEMADDIIENKKLIGKDTIELKKFLGEPDYRVDTAWMYDMGAGGGGLGFLFHQLNLKLANGIVATATHVKWKD